MKLSKRELKRIIREEKLEILEEQRGLSKIGLFNKNYIFDLFEPEFTDFLQYRRGRKRMTGEEIERFRQAVNDAVKDLINYYEE